MSLMSVRSPEAVERTSGLVEVIDLHVPLSRPRSAQEEIIDNLMP